MAFDDLNPGDVKKYLLNYSQKNHGELSSDDRRRLVEEFLGHNLSLFCSTIPRTEVKQYFREYLCKPKNTGRTAIVEIAYCTIRCPHCQAAYRNTSTESCYWAIEDLKTIDSVFMTCEDCGFEFEFKNVET